MKHNVVGTQTIVYNEELTSNTYVEGDYFGLGTVNQLMLSIASTINAPATKIFLKIQTGDNSFDYDLSPPDIPNATLVGTENQIPLNVDVYTINATNLTPCFFVPISGEKFRILARTDNAAGTGVLVVRAMQVIV